MGRGSHWRRAFAHPVGRLVIVVAVVFAGLHLFERPAPTKQQPSRDSVERPVIEERVRTVGPETKRVESGKPRPLSDAWVLATADGVPVPARDPEAELRRLRSALPVEAVDTGVLPELLYPPDSEAGPSVVGRISMLREMAFQGLDESQAGLMLGFLKEAKNLPGHELWFADEVFNALRAQDPAPVVLENAFAEVLDSATTDPNVRDYAAQHLGHLLEAGHAGGIAEEALLKAVRVGKGVFAGSALMSLQRASSEGALTTGSKELLTLAEELASTGSSVSSRIAAVTVVARLDPARGNALAASLGNDPGQPLAMRSFLYSFTQPRNSPNP
ncbi:hypothetical protein Hhel01_03586 [Haloferula helveola]